jgi:hypothetical protein
MNAKNKKKRNKQYQGADAAVTKPVITRVTAADRSKPAQWWFDHKRMVKPILISLGIVIVIVVIIVELVRILSGH